LLLYWHVMMQTPALAQSLSKNFDHVLVDEYQDTSTLQGEIVLALKPDGKGVTVVGDDAQAIYSFRAAAVENILGFADRYKPKADMIVLSQNYRSTQQILDSANALMADGARQHRKTLMGTRQSHTKPFYVALDDAQRVYVARTYAYVAGGRQGLAIIDVERPERMRLAQLFDGGGALRDVRDVVVASTNASLFAYVADGGGGLKVIQLTAPDTQPKFYGFSPEPKPELIAEYATHAPALSLSKGLDRDRGVDETGHQIAVFGRRGSGPLTLEGMHQLYLDADGQPWFAQPIAK